MQLIIFSHLSEQVTAHLQSLIHSHTVHKAVFLMYARITHQNRAADRRVCPRPEETPLAVPGNHGSSEPLRQHGARRQQCEKASLYNFLLDRALFDLIAGGIVMLIVILHRVNSMVLDV